MSLPKTSDNLRNFTYLEKYPVYESLPAYFELEYPKFTQFLEKYYEYLSELDTSRSITDEAFIRDFVEVGDDLLRFLSQELLLGRDYFDKFVDKRNAVQVSNLLYRSKGTKYAIQMFFRVFFGFDVDIRYGRNEVFLVGDPGKEESVYTSEYRDGYLYPGQRLRFTFDDGEIQVLATAKQGKPTVVESLYVEVYNDGTEPYAEDQNDYVEEFARGFEFNVYFPLREEIDYTIDYYDKSVVLQKIPEGYEPVYDDVWINFLAENGFLPEGASAKIEVKRNFPANSSIGSEVTDKRITNNGFWQLYSLAIRAPISISKWKEAYKDFVHPAGMYVEGEVLVQTTDKLFGTQSSAIMEEYAKATFSEDEILSKMQASITELNIDKFSPTRSVGYTQSGFVQNDRTPYSSTRAFDSDGVPFYSEERLDSDRPDTVYRTRINDIKELSKKGFTLEQLDLQYQRMDRIDTIEPRRFDNVEADLSSTINLFDENQWYGQGDIFCLDSDGKTQFSVLGNLLDFPKEYAGCPGYIFNLFGLLQPLRGYSSTGENFHIVTGVAEQKFSAYRDQRVWGTTADPGTSITAPNQPFNYSDNVDSAGNPLGGTSRWDDELDYANAFEFAVVQGVARTIRTYFFNRDPVTGQPLGYIDLSPGTPSPGDSADYMVAHIRIDSAGGTGYDYAHLDSAFDSIGDHFP